MKEFLVVFLFIGFCGLFFWGVHEFGEQCRAETKNYHESLRRSYNKLALKRHKPQLTEEEVAPINTIQLQLMYTKLLEN